MASPVDTRKTEHIVMDELEKLREANSIAQKLLRQRSSIHKENQNSKNEILSNNPTVPVIKKSMSHFDIWGAEDYLQESENLSFVESYLQRTQKLLKRNAELVAVKPATYELVDDVASLYPEEEPATKSDFVENNLQDSEDALTKEVPKEVPVSNTEDCDLFQTLENVKDSSLTTCLEKAEESLMKTSKLNFGISSNEVKPSWTDIAHLSDSSVSGRSLQPFHFLNFDKEQEYGSNSKALSNYFVTKLGTQENRGVEPHDCDSVFVVSKKNKFLDFEDIDSQRVEETKKVKNLLEQVDREIEIVPGYSGDHVHSSFPDSLPSENHTEDYSASHLQNGIKDDIGKCRNIVSQVSSALPRNLKEDYFGTKVAQSKFKVNGKTSRKNSKNDIMKKMQETEKLLEDFTTKVIEHRAMLQCSLESLPDEMILKILSYLCPTDLKNVAATNTKLNRISKDPYLWHTLKVIGGELTNEWFDNLMPSKWKTVNFHSCLTRGLKARHFRAFFRQCAESLREIHISECKDEMLYGDNILLHLSSRCRNVKKIVIPWSNTSNNGISALTSSEIMLTCLDVGGNCFISDESIVPFLQQKARNLHTLKLTGCFALTCSTFTTISQCCQNLKTLHMGLCPKVTPECMGSLFQSLNLIEELDIRGLKLITDETLSLISVNSQLLTRIIIANCTAVTDTGITALTTNLPGLTLVDISGCTQITDDGVSSLAFNLQNLVYLNVSNTAVSHVSIQNITENCYDTLETLKASFCTTVTNESIQKLISFCFQLKCLHLHGCKRVKIKDLLEKNHNGLEISA